MIDCLKSNEKIIFFKEKNSRSKKIHILKIKLFPKVNFLDIGPKDQWEFALRSSIIVQTSI